MCSWPMVPVMVLAALLLALPARAQGTDEALYLQGVELLSRHEDAPALEAFRQLYARSSQPRALAQMGIAEGALSRWVVAETHVQEALGHAGDPWIRRNRQALEGALQTIRSHLGDLLVECPVPGAEVRVGSQRLATLPMTAPARVVAGTVTFEVRAAGFLTAMRTATVTAGGLAREAVELVAVPGAASVAAPAGVVPAAGPAAGRVVAGGERSPGEPATLRTMGIVSAAGAGLLLAGGLLAYLVGDRAARSHEDPAQGCPGLGADSMPPQCAGWIDTVSTMQPLAITGFIGAGVLAAVSVVLFVASPSRHPGTMSGRLGCSRGPGQVGMACGFRF